MTSLPPTPIAGITYPKSDLISKAFAFINEHHNPTVANHVIRSSLFALVIIRKLPHLKDCDPESIVLATLLHDLGWSASPSLVSPDKRFEVDGANDARDFIKATANGSKYDDHCLQQIWYAIALHTTTSISLHAQPFVAAVAMGIMSDFLGPNMPGGVSIEEFKEIVGAYPRLGMAGELREVMCGLCKKKPETTYDNFVGLFGLRDVPGYKEQWEKNNARDMLEGALKACEQYED